MSDISLKFTWWELLLASPIIGWPGAIAGAIIGALVFKRAWARTAGAPAGAILGNVAWAFTAIYFK